MSRTANLLTRLSLLAAALCAGLFLGSAALGELPERCLLLPENSCCAAHIPAYYFNQFTRKCTEYIYDGCGPVVPFKTLEECQRLCERAAKPGPERIPLPNHNFDRMKKETEEGPCEKLGN